EWAEQFQIGVSRTVHKRMISADLIGVECNVVTDRLRGLVVTVDAQFQVIQPSSASHVRQPHVLGTHIDSSSDACQSSMCQRIRRYRIIVMYDRRQYTVSGFFVKPSDLLPDQILMLEFDRC